MRTNFPTRFAIQLLIAITPLSAVAESYQIVYGSASWNKSPSQIDTALLFFRDQSSGKVVRVNLDETEPDSSIFAGDFVLDAGTGRRIQPEVYIPNQKIRGNEAQLQAFQRMLTTRSVLAQPLIEKKISSGKTTLDVYDTASQAQAAKDAYQKELEAKANEQKTLAELTKPVPTAQELEAAQHREHQLKLQRLAQDAAVREQERIRIEQIEQQKLRDQKAASDALTESKRAAQRAEAKALADQALQAYEAGDYKMAEGKFRKSIELEPSNRENQFRYGVCLYRNEKFDEALVALKLTPDDPSTSVEKKYYMGLIHMRLKELKSALDMFSSVAQSNREDLAPSALFYQGVILYAQERYREAKVPFEKVIDVSQDPKLDQQAEEYLERIVRAEQQKHLQSKKLFVNASAGLMYDSNILLAADNVTSQGSALRIDDARFMGSADVEYRPIFTNQNEFGAKMMGYMLYSNKPAASKADPYLVNASTPWTYKGTAFARGYKSTLRPAYEATWMNYDGSPPTEIILSSTILGWDQTFVMDSDWFSVYSLEVRQDVSGTNGVGDSDADAFRATFKTSQMLMLSPGNKEALIGSLGGVLNNAKGSSIAYKRYEVGVVYVRPTGWDTSTTIGLTYYTLDFDQSSTGRKDANFNLTLGLSKPLTKAWTLGLTGAIINNDSNSVANDYSRYTLMTSASYTGAF